MGWKLLLAVSVPYCSAKKKKKKEYIKYVNSFTPFHSILEPLTKHGKATITTAASEKRKTFREQTKFLNIH